MFSGLSWTVLCVALSTLTSAWTRRIPTTSETGFQLDGQPWNYAGTNAFWVAFQANESLIRETLSDVHNDGYRVLRIWAFADFIVGQPMESRINQSQVWFQSWQDGKPTVNYHENGLPRLDQVVRAAEQYDIKLILTMANNWVDFGGMDVYVNATSPGSSHDLFYRDPVIISYFKDYVKAIVTRFQNSDAIFAWELANEARCTGSNSDPVPQNCTTTTITSWADEISTYIKSLDPNHMVSFGGEGFFNWPNRTDYEYNGGSGQDYDALLALENIDFGTVHLYPNGANEDLAWSMQWLIDHDTASVAANKPVVLEEYGFPRANTTPDRLQVYTQWHDYELQSKSFNGDMVWSFGDDAFRVYGGLPNDTYAIYPEDSDFQALVVDFVREMNRKP